MTKSSLGLLLGSALAIAVVSNAIIGRLSSERERDTLRAYKSRLDQHCTFERVHLETLQRDLESTNQMVRDNAKHVFENMVLEDFRSARLCMDDRVTNAMINPGDRAMFCTKTFRNDLPCMRSVIQLARLYIQ